jgi:hypothetical protein
VKLMLKCNQQRDCILLLIEKQLHLQHNASMREKEDAEASQEGSLYSQSLVGVSRPSLQQPRTFQSAGVVATVDDTSTESTRGTPSPQVTNGGRLGLHAYVTPNGRTEQIVEPEITTGLKHKKDGDLGERSAKRAKLFVASPWTIRLNT